MTAGAPITAANSVIITTDSYKSILWWHFHATFTDCFVLLPRFGFEGGVCGAMSGLDGGPNTASFGISPFLGFFFLAGAVIVL